MTRIAYLGPRGTFTEQAARNLATHLHEPTEPTPAETVPAALTAVRDGSADAATVPVENSVDGAITATMDALVRDEPLVAVAETLLPIRFSILARPGLAFTDVHTVSTHPTAAAQVRRWLREHLPNADLRTTSSTAAAAQAAQHGEVDAAVAAPLAGEHYALAELASDIADVRDATTRFLLVRRPGEPPAATGADRTSVATVIRSDVGTLGEMLAEFSLRGINLSRIESRPLADRFGEYRFFLDLDGHVADASVGDALAALHRRCREVRFLGSFARADATPSPVRSDATEPAFRASADWLARVRAGELA